MATLKKIYIDVMVNGYFYKQVTYLYSPIFGYTERQLKEYVLQEYPSLKDKNWEIAISNQRIMK